MVSRLSNAIISIFRKGEKRISSQEFEQAVNQVLLSDTVADAAKKPLITPEGSFAISAVWGCVRIFRDHLLHPVHLQKLRPYECKPILTVDDEVVYQLSNGELLPSNDIILLKLKWGGGILLG